MKKAMRLLSTELENAELGDRRLSRRLGQIADAWAERPSEGLPNAMRTQGALEGAYRFLSNRRVTAEAIIEPHIQASLERARAEASVLALHDTTECEFGGEQREGLGRLTAHGRGFFAHVALAVAESSSRPLGVVGLSTHVRDQPAPTRAGRKSYAYQTRDEKESNRWWDTVAAVQSATAGQVSWIHVADCEADCYRMLAQIVDGGDDFVIRGKHDRVLEESGHLKEVARSATAMVEREVPLSARPERRAKNGERLAKKQHPPRRARIARLSISAVSVRVKRSWAVPAAFPAHLDLNVVRVYEETPPDGEPAVEWLLLTTLPIDTANQLERVVDIYRTRWLIEEFFKALKTGCRYEQLQLESYSTLTNALAIVVTVAWHALLLRQLSRAPDVFASAVLTSTQLDVLRAVSPLKLSAHPMARDALLAVAALGGHIKNNGDPGWLVLYRGFRELLTLQRGWQARSDQS